MIEIKQIYEKEKYMNLILEADPEKEIVEKYIKEADMYGLFKQDEILAEIIITKVDNNICELKNIATMEKARGKGYGKKLIQYIMPIYANKYKKMIVGTTQNNIPFYVKCGFDKYYKTEYNFFVDNYTEEVWDEDLHCIDMYYYYIDLQKLKENYEIIEINESNREKVNEILIEEWESTNIIVRGQVIDGTKLQGFIAQDKNKEIIGLITYLIWENNECEIISLNSNIPKKGIGTKLIEKVRAVANEKGCKTMKLITTNDNTNALYFYQKRGFIISNIYFNAMAESRKLKPEIPKYAENGIEIKDEIELRYLI